MVSLKQDEFLKKIVLIDAVSPRGHVSINKFYLQTLSKRNVELVVSDELEPLYRGVGKINVFKYAFLTKGRIIHSLYSLFIILKVLFSNFFKRKYILILLSYDITNLFIVSHCAKILGVKLVVFEHNTVPDGSKYKRILQRMCTNEMLRICLLPEAKKEYESLNQSSVVINHPIMRERDKVIENEKLSKLIQQFDKVVFSPSGSADLSELKKYCEKYPKYLFIVKSGEKFDVKNCYTSSFFDEYNWIMTISDFVYLPVKFTKRVSGPMYGAIYHSCKIIVNRNSFGEFALSQFSHSVQYCDENWVTEQRGFDVAAYNSNIADDFLNVLS